MNKLVKINEGSYGIVYKAIDKTTGKEVAIKRNIVAELTSFNNCLSELDILLKLRNHPNIIRIDTIFYGKDNFDFIPTRPEFRDNDVHFSFESADCDLYGFMGKLTYPEMRFLMLDMIHGIKYIHSQGILHRDIKPANLLIFTNKCDGILPEGRKYLKICDFGLSAMMLNNKCKTPNVVTAWYRAPECIVGNDYGTPLDIWSIGTILYEIFTGLPLCRDSQLEESTLRDVMSDCLPFECFKNADNKWFKKGKLSGIPKSDFVKSLNIDLIRFEIDLKSSFYQFVDLLIGCLMVTPGDRFTIDQIINHDLFTPIRDIKRVEIIKPSTTIKITDDKQRKDMYDQLLDIYSKKNDIKWYTDRLLFLSASIIDRFFEWKHITDTDKIEHSDYGLALRGLVIVYLSLKYFSTLTSILSFDRFVEEQYRTVEAFKFAQEFEACLASEILKNNIYTVNLYEKLYPEIDTPRALIFLKNISSFDGTIDDLVSAYDQSPR